MTLTANNLSANLLAGTMFEEVEQGYTYVVRARSMQAFIIATSGLITQPRAKVIFDVGSTTFSEKLIANGQVTTALPDDNVSMHTIRSQLTDDDIVFEGDLPSGQASLKFFSSAADPILFDISRRG